MNGASNSPVTATQQPARKAVQDEMPAEHALLGLIVDAGGEAYGYELARHFEPAQPLGEVLHLEQAMLYQYLKKLERRGWLTVSVQPQETRPPRRVYHITPQGRAELRRWLEEPVGRTREIRLEFLLKLFFAFRHDPVLADRLVAEQQAVCRQLLASLESQLRALAERGERSGDNAPADGFQRLVLELRREQTRAAMIWLERVATRGDRPEADVTT